MTITEVYVIMKHFYNYEDGESRVHSIYLDSLTANEKCDSLDSDGENYYEVVRQEVTPVG